MKRALAVALVLTLLATMVAGCGATPEPGVVEKVVTQVVEVQKEVTRVVEGPPVVQTVVETQVVEVTSTPEPIPEQAQACPYTGGTLVRAIGVAPSKMDPLTSNWMTEGTGGIYETLVTRNPKDGSWQPGLAESWEMSSDGLAWTFHLRKGVKFHDGTPFNADAVKFYVDKSKEPAFLFGWLFTTLESAEVVDDYTVILHLSGPAPNLLHSLSTIYAGIPSPTAWEKLGEDYGNVSAVGTGPYIFESLESDVLRIARNEDYAWAPQWAWNQGPPCVDTIEYRYIPDSAALVAALEAGDVHMTSEVPPSSVEQLLSNPDIRVQTVAGWGSDFVTLLPNPPLDDIVVRKALSHSLDRDTTIQVVWRGYAQPMDSFLPTQMAGYYDGGKEATAYDPKLAADLFAQAGYTKGSDGILEKDGKDLVLEIVTPTDTTYRRWAETMQAQLREVGVDTTVKAMEWGARDGYVSQPGNGHLSLTLYVWDHISILNFFFHSANIPLPNLNRLNDPKVDALLEAAGSAKSVKEMFQITDELQKYLTDLYLWIPVATPNQIWAFRKEVGGFYPSFFQEGSTMSYQGGVYLSQ
jgi:peptide/nickel transport system substrate-binding protein